MRNWGERADSSFGRFIKRITSSHVFLSGVALVALAFPIVFVSGGSGVALACTACAALRFLHLEHHLAPAVKCLQVQRDERVFNAVVCVHGLLEDLEQGKADVCSGGVVRDLAVLKMCLICKFEWEGLP